MAIHFLLQAHGPSVGTAAATARTLLYYAAASGNTEAKDVAKKLLDGLWTHYRTDQGISLVRTWETYIDFNHKVS